MLLVVTTSVWGRGTQAPGSSGLSATTAVLCKSPTLARGRRQQVQVPGWHPRSTCHQWHLWCVATLADPGTTLQLWLRHEEGHPCLELRYTPYYPQLSCFNCGRQEWLHTSNRFFLSRQLVTSIFEVSKHNF